MRDAATPRISRPLSRWFGAYARRYVRRHVHAVRVLRRDLPSDAGDAPLLIVLNHPSWWDPMIAFVLRDRFFPRREHYAPMDAAALERYRFFGRLGMFGVERGTPRGAATFLRVGEAVLARPRGTLWVTAQGRFEDPRVRPTVLMPGVGLLAARMPRGSVLPLALEYPFWEERTPEALAAFGTPMAVGSGDTEGWTARIAEALERTQDVLATAAAARDGVTFETILGGRAGVGGVYDLWRSLRARLKGERFDREHGVRDR